MRPNVEVDFTHNRNEIMQGLYANGVSAVQRIESSSMRLRMCLDRIKDVKGKKAVLVLASGRDTFSKMNLDQIMKRIRETDATIFTVGVGEQLFLNGRRHRKPRPGRATEFPPGGKPNENFCGHDRRTRVVPAL